MELYTHINQEDKTLLEMAEIGRLDTLIIRVYGNEGPIPHFHFENKDRTIKGCIRIDEPKYFKHGQYQSKLHGKQLKNVIEFLNAPHKKLGKYGLNNWEVISMYWDDNNVDYPVPEDLNMPDYNILNGEE